MNNQDNLISQLEGVLGSGDLSRRAEILRRVSDLFLVGSGSFTGEQIDLFDEVMGRLIENVDVALRAELSNRLARQVDAPRCVSHTLAFDDEIDVAGPMLRHSERLDEAVLVANAMTKGHGHLLAISSRRVLSEALTDVLVERGDRAVARSVAGNDGAKFSSMGLSTLTKRSREDVDLVVSLWKRTDIPRQVQVKLFTEASEMTRKALEAERPRQAAEVRQAVAAATNEIRAQARRRSEDYGRGHNAVRSLHAAGQLDEARLFTFACEGAFDKTVSALALMCDLPVGLIEACLAQKRTEQILVLARAIDLSWETTSALLLMQSGDEGTTRNQLDQCFTTFSRLQKKTAQTALQFYRMREIARG